MIEIDVESKLERSWFCGYELWTMKHGHSSN